MTASDLRGRRTAETKRGLAGWDPYTHILSSATGPLRGSTLVDVFVLFLWRTAFCFCTLLNLTVGERKVWQAVLSRGASLTACTPAIACTATPLSSRTQVFHLPIWLSLLPIAHLHVFPGWFQVEDRLTVSIGIFCNSKSPSSPLSSASSLLTSFHYSRINQRQQA